MDSHDSFIAQDSAGSLTPSRSDDLANSLLNFTTTPDELDLQNVKRQKSARDPMSHRIIEKRRRDRMNNCLADLSRLIPTSYLKQGQGRIEKTEIIEMAIKHIKTLQAQVDSSQSVTYNTPKLQQGAETATASDGSKGDDHSCCRERFYQGFKECQDETLRYFVEGEAMVASDPFCARVMDHLSSVAKHFEPPHMLSDDKLDVVMEVDQQATTGSSSSFGGNLGGVSMSGMDPVLPLLPTSSGMIVPASPVRNKQLRNLLTARALQQLEAERETVTSQSVEQPRCGSSSEASSLNSPAMGSVATTSSTTTQPNASTPLYVSPISGDTMMPGVDVNMNGGGISSGYASESSAMDRYSSSSGPSAGLGELMMSSKDSNAMNIYKFKHNITKRFSQEGKVISQQYDGSSSASSREAEDEHHGSFKHRPMKTKSRHPSSSDSGPYPTSEHSGGVSTSSHESGEAGAERSRNRKSSAKSTAGVDSAEGDMESCARAVMPLPGFVLHPSGTHYMPMSVCCNNIPEILDSGSEPGIGPPVFHPISIPVHFKGPVISVPGSNVYANSSKSTEASSQCKDTKAVKKLPGF